MAYLRVSKSFKQQSFNENSDTVLGVSKKNAFTSITNIK